MTTCPDLTFTVHYNPSLILLTILRLYVSVALLCSLFKYMMLEERIQKKKKCSNLSGIEIDVNQHVKPLPIKHSLWVFCLQSCI